MKHRLPIRPFLVRVLLGLSMLSTLQAERLDIPLNDNWFFTKNPVVFNTPAKGWERVTLPHTWNSTDVLDGRKGIRTTLQTPEEAAADARARKAARQKTDDPSLKFGYYRGACWYSRVLEIPADWKGKKRVFVRFGAANSVARTYINKKLLGEHRGGYTAFCYELTDDLNYGGKNELRVQVDNSQRDDLAPLSADYDQFGGLYRGAELIVTDMVCISPLEYASSGVYLTTTSLADDRADVEVRTIVSNGNEAEQWKRPPAPVPVTVRTEIRDAGGSVVAHETTPREVPAELTDTVVQKLVIPNPHRWNGRKDPYLYSVTVSLLFGDKVIDRMTQSLGLRTVAISQEQGFLLNGEPYAVHGVNRHQDVRGKGWAILPSDEERDMKIISEMGVTAVRNAHYPQSENWHRLADRDGMLLWDEVSNVDATRSTRAFWLNSEEMLREMIHQLYNHPAIAWWGMFNEIGLGKTPPSSEGIARLQSVTKEIDTNRIIVCAVIRAIDPDKSDAEAYADPLNKVTDEIGLNRYPGWYYSPKTLNGLPNTNNPVPMDAIIDRFAREVGKRFAISEYGAGGDVAHHTEGAPVKPEDTASPFHPEEWQTFVHEQDWARMKDNPHLWGTFLWNMFDFSSWKRDEGSTPMLNDKGLVTHDRAVKKDAYYFYKANWNNEPMVYIASRRATRRREPKTEVKIYSNCPEVELKVNGTSLGKRAPDADHIVRFEEVLLAPGKNLIEVTGSSEGGTLRDSCEWTLTQPLTHTSNPGKSSGE